MATEPIGRPRVIDPSLIEPGDDIEVVHKRDQGVIMTLRGVVAKRSDSGNVRYLSTAEGATLLAWEPGRRGKVTVTLYGRETNPHPSLFAGEFLEEITERLAS